MPTTVSMPSIGESVTEATVTRWLKQEGETVAFDEPLLEVSTDKVDTEIPSPTTGVLSKIIAHEDDVVAIGAPLAIIAEASEAIEGFRRSQSEFKIAAEAAGDITDESHFESPDGDVKYALPRYALQRDAVGTAEEPRIVIVDDEGSDLLAVTLAKVPGPAADPGTEEMPHHVRVFMQMNIPSSRQFELTVDPSHEGDAVFTATSTLADGVREQLVAALGSPQADVTVSVQRIFMISAPTGKFFGDGEPAFLDHQVILEWTVPPRPLVLSERQRRRLEGGGASQTRRVPVEFGNRTFTYVHDADEPERFFYLPDMFLLSRSPESPHRPELRFAVVSGEPGAEQYSMEFTARPFTDERRLEAARPALEKAAAQLGSIKPVILDRRTDAQPLLLIALPRNGAPSPELTRRAGAQIDLETGVTHAEVFGAEDFLFIFQALNNASLTLLTGEVRVDPDDPMAEDIPLQLRLDRPAGPVLQCDPRVITQPVTDAQLTNTIESPVVIRDLRATAVGATDLPIQTDGLAPDIRLAPGASCAVRMTLQGPVTNPPQTIDLGQSDIAVEPDRQAIWNLVFDRHTEAKLTRDVTVRAVPEMFANPARPDDEVFEFRVSIENGDSVVLTKDNLKVTTKRRVPIIPVITGESLPPWRYRTETAWKSGGLGVSKWRETDVDSISPVPTLPAD